MNARTVSAGAEPPGTVPASTVQAGAVLVTGAGGFIGRALGDAFRARGLTVIGVDLVGDGKDVVAGSVENPAPWEHLFDRVQLVVHTAALVTNAMPDDEMWRGNVLATRNLVAACVRRKVQRFVHVSSIVVYGNSAVGELDEEHPVQADGGSYVTTKLAAEHVVLDPQGRRPAGLEARGRPGGRDETVRGLGQEHRPAMRPRGGESVSGRASV